MVGMVYTYRGDRPDDHPGSHPTLELTKPSPFVSDASPNSLPALPDGRVIAHVNYSPPFQAPLPPSTPAEFFSAFARFEALLARPEARFEYRLQEGDAVLFDNRRMFHARGPFEEELTGPDAVRDRWLKGGYFEADEVLDKRRVLLRNIG
jgi:gamma-butyrobetaine dioxygenase